MEDEIRNAYEEMKAAAIGTAIGSASQDSFEDSQQRGCKECGADPECFDTNDGFVVCTECGVTQDTDVSEEPEWGNYKAADGSNEPDRARAYSNKDELNPFSREHGTRMGKGLKTQYVKDGKVRTFDLSRLHDQMNYTHKQRSYDTVRNYFENVLSDKFHKSIIHTAQVLWGEIAQSGKITRGGVRKGLIACCVYYSCIHHGTTYSPLEISKILGYSDTKEFVKGDKEFKEIFVDNRNWNTLLQKTSNSDCFFGQFCDKLKIEWHLQRKCSVLYNLHKKKLAQVIPKSAAAGCIYYVLTCEGSEKFTKYSISKELGVCVPTLVKVYDILEKEENRRIRKGVVVDMPKKVVTRTSKYAYNFEVIALGKK